MQDVFIKPDEDGIYDIQISGSDFTSVDGFDTAIPISFFTDSRAPVVQVQEARNRRGWVGNILTIDQDRELGSLLWILDQTRLARSTLNFARTFVQDCLQWLTDDGEARSVSVEVTKSGDRGIKIYTDITTIDNTVQRYVTLWVRTTI